jgi:hypothetical protein
MPIAALGLSGHCNGYRATVAVICNINTFMVIKSHENHHAIIDNCGVTLGYRYHIKPELLKTLEETTADLPHMGVNAGKRGNYPTRHYTVWRDYSKEPYESADY